MSSFRKGQNKSNITRINYILSTIILILIMNIFIQIWILYTTLNNALDNNREILLPAFLASFVIFLISAGLLYYLPTGRLKPL
jgi:uncharacterized BrkB/YihY/UPF0761 family membrane protein